MIVEAEVIDRDGDGHLMVTSKGQYLIWNPTDYSRYPIGWIATLDTEKHILEWIQ